MRDFRDAKLMAKSLREALAERKVELTHSQVLELVAAQFGYDNWNILAAKIDASEPQQRKPDAVSIQPAIPIFRIFSVDKAMEFYRDFLGFTVDWEHRFGENFPLYCQISRSGMLMHLSEHAGDASPGARVFVPMTGARAFQQELIGRNYHYMKPGLEQADWGLEVTVTDPFSNRITFCEREIKPQG
ncbi:glyoxalase superfamily protein [Neorhizobium galegae]|uniref:Bleomycin resistance protein n=1 Tax=Neorhizobium galegae bv. officinalis TaxID=323656 RepID=A0A0T7G9X2_NEOGA|nr:glyoxalase superfamily protein [Neorhizobium galegae]CDZ43998.1 Glyoxalase/bleomycin resistance protein/dioxygenase superfamily protein 23 [Neorhizobium galegae bv. officinalis]